MQNNEFGCSINSMRASTRKGVLYATWCQLERISTPVLIKSVGDLYYFWKTAWVDNATSRSRPPGRPNRPKSAQMPNFGPNLENQKTIEKPMEFCVFWVRTGNVALQQNHRCRNKIVKNPLVFIAFSESEAIERLLVERVLIDRTSTILGRICYKHQWCFNDCVSSMFDFK